MNDVEVGPSSKETKEKEEISSAKVLIALAKNWREDLEKRPTEMELSSDSRMTSMAAGKMAMEKDFDLLVFVGGMVRKRKNGVNEEIESGSELLRDSTMSEAEAMFRFSLQRNHGLFERIDKIVVHNAEGNIEERKPSDYIAQSKLKESADPKDIGQKITVYLEEKAIDTVTSAREVVDVLGRFPTDLESNEDNILKNIDDESVVMTVGYHLKRSKKDFTNEGLDNFTSVASDELLAKDNKLLKRLQERRRRSGRITVEHGRETVARILQTLDPEGKMLSKVTEKLRRGNTKTRL